MSLNQELREGKCIQQEKKKANIRLNSLKRFSQRKLCLKLHNLVEVMEDL